MQSVISVLLMIGGVVLAAFAIHGIRSRPGWDSPYGVGALLLVVGGVLVIIGVVRLYLFRN